MTAFVMFLAVVGAVHVSAAAVVEFVVWLDEPRG